MGWKSSTTSETQIGSVTESLVAAQLILASHGRLSPFKPVADDGGIDLLVFDKVTGMSVPLQVKSRTRTLNGHPKVAHFQVRRATFDRKQGGFLLAVLMQIEEPPVHVRRAWFIPMPELDSVARLGRENLVIRPSHDNASKDRLTPYRCANLDEVARRVIHQCESLAVARKR